MGLNSFMRSVGKAFIRSAQRARNAISIPLWICCIPKALYNIPGRDIDAVNICAQLTTNSSLLPSPSAEWRMMNFGKGGNVNLNELDGVIFGRDYDQIWGVCNHSFGAGFVLTGSTSFTSVSGKTVCVHYGYILVVECSENSKHIKVKLWYPKDGYIAIPDCSLYINSIPNPDCLIGDLFRAGNELGFTGIVYPVGIEFEEDADLCEGPDQTIDQVIEICNLGVGATFDIPTFSFADPYTGEAIQVPAYRANVQISFGELCGGALDARGVFGDLRRGSYNINPGGTCGCHACMAGPAPKYSCDGFGNCSIDPLGIYNDIGECIRNCEYQIGNSGELDGRRIVNLDCCPGQQLPMSLNIAIRSLANCVNIELVSTLGWSNGFRGWTLSTITGNSQFLNVFFYCQDGQYGLKIYCNGTLIFNALNEPTLPCSPVSEHFGGSIITPNDCCIGSIEVSITGASGGG